MLIISLQKLQEEGELLQHWVVIPAHHLAAAKQTTE